MIMRRSLLRTALTYGLVIAAISILLQLIAYRHQAAMLSLEAYIAIIGLLFISLGLWVGISLTPARRRETPFFNDAAAREIGLTGRELDILEELASGASNKEIARRLSISPHTVKTHLTSIASKMGVSGRQRLVNEARSLSLVDRG